MKKRSRNAPDKGNGIKPSEKGQDLIRVAAYVKEMEILFFCIL